MKIEVIIAQLIWKRKGYSLSTFNIGVDYTIWKVVTVLYEWIEKYDIINLQIGNRVLLLSRVIGGAHSERHHGICK